MSACLFTILMLYKLNHNQTQNNRIYWNWGTNSCCLECKEYSTLGKWRESEEWMGDFDKHDCSEQWNKTQMEQRRRLGWDKKMPTKHCVISTVISEDKESLYREQVKFKACWFTGRCQTKKENETPMRRICFSTQASEGFVFVWKGRGWSHTHKLSYE